MLNVGDQSSRHLPEALILKGYVGICRGTQGRGGRGGHASLKQIFF